MALLSGYLKITYGYTVSFTEEIAQTGLRWAGDSTFDAAAAIAEVDVADAQSLLEDFYGTVHIGSPLLWGSYSHLVYCKIAAVGANGAYVGEPVIYSNDMGVGGSGEVPIQSTVCVTLHSGETLGDANYGRMYLPHTRLTQDTGRATATTANCDIVAGYLVDHLEHVNTTLAAAVTQAGLPVIMSDKGTGTTKSISEVRIGNVTDVQRRRRNNLPETYSVATTAYGA